MTPRRLDEILALLAADVHALSGFARNLEHTVFGATEAALPVGQSQEIQRFDALIQHLDDLERILGAVSAMPPARQTVNAAALSEVAKLGHYRRIFGPAAPVEHPPDPGHVDLF